MAKGKATMKGNTKPTKAPPKKSAPGPSKKKAPQKASAPHQNSKNKGRRRLRASDDDASSGEHSGEESDPRPQRKFHGKAKGISDDEVMLVDKDGEDVPKDSEV
jgi:hypothetical protein